MMTWLSITKYSIQAVQYLVILIVNVPWIWLFSFHFCPVCRTFRCRRRPAIPLRQKWCRVRLGVCPNNMGLLTIDKPSIFKAFLEVGWGWSVDWLGNGKIPGGETLLYFRGFKRHTHLIQSWHDPSTGRHTKIESVYFLQLAHKQNCKGPLNLNPLGSAATWWKLIFF